MKRIIKSSKLEYYNATPNNKHEDDCVIRSISLATNESYNYIKERLEGIAEQINESSNNVRYEFNNPEVYNVLLNEYNIEGPKDISRQLGYTVTVSEFADRFSGKYLVECGDTAAEIDHIVYIDNGKIYDSWDCSNEVAVYCYTLANMVLEDTNISYDIEQYTKELEDYLEDRLDSRCQDGVNDTYDRSINGNSFRYWIYTKYLKYRVKVSLEFEFDFEMGENPVYSVMLEYSPYMSIDDFMDSSENKIDIFISDIVNTIARI